MSEAVFQTCMHCTASYCFALLHLSFFKFLHPPFNPATFPCWIHSHAVVLPVLHWWGLLYSGQNVGLNLRTFFWLVREQKKTGTDIPNHTGIYHLFMHIMQVPNWYHKYLVHALKRNKPRPCHPHAVAAEALGLRWHGCLLAKVNFR